MYTKGRVSEVLQVHSGITAIYPHPCVSMFVIFAIATRQGFLP